MTTDAQQPQRDSVTFTFLLGGNSVCGMDGKPESCTDCSEMPNCVLDCFYEVLSRPHTPAPEPPRDNPACFGNIDNNPNYIERIVCRHCFAKNDCPSGKAESLRTAQEHP